MHLIHSIEIPDTYIEKLGSLIPKLNRIPIPKDRDVYRSISSHPDIFLFQLDPSTIIYSRSLDAETFKQIARTGVDLIEASHMPKGTYPETASLNAVRIGKFILHNKKISDVDVIRKTEKKGLTLIHIEQGYTRCSAIPVNENAIITPDHGIAKASKACGLDVLLVSPGNIKLPGEDYGFIGGASGIMPNGKIVFLGDITKHPDLKLIRSFLNKHKVEFLFLPGLPLLDAGSLIFLP